MEKSLFVENVTISQLKHSKQKQFFEYWISKKGDKLMPARSQLKPEEMVAVLPHIILFDYLKDEEDFQVRLIGTESSRRLGENKGKKLSQMKEYSSALERCIWCVKNRKPYYVEGRLDSKEKLDLDFASLVMPLSEDGENVDMIVLISQYS